MYPETVQSTGDRSKQSRKKTKKNLCSYEVYTVVQSKKKKGLNDPDNHDNVVTYLEPDILECEVR